MCCFWAVFSRVRCELFSPVLLLNSPQLCFVLTFLACVVFELTSPVMLFALFSVVFELSSVVFVVTYPRLCCFWAIPSVVFWAFVSVLFWSSPCLCSIWIVLKLYCGVSVRCVASRLVRLGSESHRKVSCDQMYRDAEEIYAYPVIASLSWRCGSSMKR